MNRAELVALWLRYAVANAAHADRLEKSGDSFGASLCRARGEVRQEAAQLLHKSRDPLAAALHMHQFVQLHWQLDLPLVGFDEAAVIYTKTRTWQNCARTIDPELPEIQPLLKWDTVC